MTPTPKPKPMPRMRDDAGEVIPARIEAVWKRRADLRKAVRMMSDSASLLEKLHEEAPALFAHTQYDVALAWLDSAAFALRQGMPSRLCPMCRGIGCRVCRSSGMLSKEKYAACVSDK